jgi:WD40 repeat protein
MRTNRFSIHPLLTFAIGALVLTGWAAASENNAKRTNPVSGPWKQVALLKVNKASHLLQFSPDGKLLAAGSVGDFNQFGQLLPCEITLWDVASRKLRKQLKGHKGTIAGLAFSPDGKKLVSVCYSGLLKHWDVADGKLRSTVSLGLTTIAAVAFSPDRKIMATAVGNIHPGQALLGGQVQLWNVATGKKLATIAAHDCFVNHLFYSQSGKTLVTFGTAFNKNARVAPDGSSDTFIGETKFWDPATRRPKAFRAAGGSTCVFSPEGTVFITDTYDPASRKFKLKFFDLRKKNVRSSRTGHSNSLQALTSTRDGKVLASASTDRTVKLWDAATARELATLKGHRSWVSAVAFSPDGKVLASAGADSTLRLWSPAKK